MLTKQKLQNLKWLEPKDWSVGPTNENSEDFHSSIKLIFQLLMVKEAYYAKDFDGQDIKIRHLFLNFPQLLNAALLGAHTVIHTSGRAIPISQLLIWVVLAALCVKGKCFFLQRF